MDIYKLGDRLFETDKQKLLDILSRIKGRCILSAKSQETKVRLVSAAIETAYEIKKKEWDESNE